LHTSALRFSVVGCSLNSLRHPPLGKGRARTDSYRLTRGDPRQHADQREETSKPAPLKTTRVRHPVTLLRRDLSVGCSLNSLGHPPLYHFNGSLIGLSVTFRHDFDASEICH